METDQIDDLNSGFVQELLADYLASPESVDPEWRELFESNPELVLERLPNAARLRELSRDGGGERRPDRGSRGRPRAGRGAGGRALARRRGGGDVARQGAPDARPPGRAHRPARLGAARRPCARPGPARAAAHARAPGPDPREASCASTCPPRRWPRRSPSCARRTAGRWPTRSSTSRATSSGSGCATAIESGTYRQPLTPEEKKALLARLSEVEGFERYLRRAFLGQKQFSIEGLDVMVPMLDEAIELAAANGANHVVIGMAHRGRLNVLAHTVGRQADAILREFEGERVLEAVATDLESGSGDVKYHLGAEAARETPQRRRHRDAHLEPEPPGVRRPGRRGRGARVADEPRLGRGGARSRTWRSPSSSTETPPSPARESSPRRSTLRASPATPPAARCT